MFREVGTETNAATTLAHLSPTRDHGRSVDPTQAQPGSKDYFLIMGRSMIRPDYKEFLRLSRNATLVPVAKSISADLLTPVSAFLAVAHGEPDAFLLESVEGGEKIGRYTFLGVRPFLRLESRGAEIKIEREGAHSETEISGKRPPSQGLHRSRRHLPGRPLAALGFPARSRSARSLPRAADSESIAVHVLLTVRRRKARRPDETKQE